MPFLRWTVIISPTSAHVASTFVPFLVSVRFSKLPRGPLASGTVQPSFLPCLRNTMPTRSASGYKTQVK